jgi:excisionase family DNA binding protein
MHVKQASGEEILEGTPRVHPLSPGAHTLPHSSFFRQEPPFIAPLSLRPREAALGLSISTLARLTKAGELPCVKLGRSVLYPVAMLEEFLRTRAEGARGDEFAGAGSHQDAKASGPV